MIKIFSSLTPTKYASTFSKLSGKAYSLTTYDETNSERKLISSANNNLNNCDVKIGRKSYLTTTTSTILCPPSSTGYYYNDDGGIISHFINGRRRFFCTTTSNSNNKADEKPQVKGQQPKKTLESSGKRKQLQTYENQSAIDRMLMDKYRVPEPTTTAEKVKEGAKDVYYFSIFAVALVAAGTMFYYVFKELFSSKSPNSVYSRALKLVVANEQVQSVLGTPIKGFGEETRRGRRRHAAHAEYQKDGIKHMRMKFYVKGSNASGSVNLEVKEDEFGKYDYRYLFVDLDVFPPKSIVLIDNR